MYSTDLKVAVANAIIDGEDRGGATVSGVAAATRQHVGTVAPIIESFGFGLGDDGTVYCKAQFMERIRALTGR